MTRRRIDVEVRTLAVDDPALGSGDFAAALARELGGLVAAGAPRPEHGADGADGRVRAVARELHSRLGPSAARAGEAR